MSFSEERFSPGGRDISLLHLVFSSPIQEFFRQSVTCIRVRNLYMVKSIRRFRFWRGCTTDVSRSWRRITLITVLLYDSSWLSLMGLLGSHLVPPPYPMRKAYNDEVPRSQGILSSCLFNLQCTSPEIVNRFSSKKISQHVVLIWTWGLHPKEGPMSAIEEHIHLAGVQITWLNHFSIKLAPYVR